MLLRQPLPSPAVGGVERLTAGRRRVREAAEEVALGFGLGFGVRVGCFEVIGSSMAT